MHPSDFDMQVGCAQTSARGTGAEPNPASGQPAPLVPGAVSTRLVLRSRQKSTDNPTSVDSPQTPARLAARGQSLPSPKRAEPGRLLRCSSLKYARYSRSSRLASGPAAPILARSDFAHGLLARLARMRDGGARLAWCRFAARSWIQGVVLTLKDFLIIPIQKPIPRISTRISPGVVMVGKWVGAIMPKSIGPEA